MREAEKDVQSLVFQIAMRTNVLLPTVVFLMLAAFAAALSYQSQSAICGLVQTRLDNLSDPLGRELALGDTNVAKEIFGELKRTLYERGIRENLQLVPTSGELPLPMSDECRRG